MQILIVEVGSYAFECHIKGLTAEQWFICIAFSFISLVWRVLLLKIPSWIFPSIEDNIRVDSMSRVLSIRGDSIERNRRNISLT